MQTSKLLSKVSRDLILLVLWLTWTFYLIVGIIAIQHPCNPTIQNIPGFTDSKCKLIPPNPPGRKPKDKSGTETPREHTKDKSETVIKPPPKPSIECKKTPLTVALGLGLVTMVFLSLTVVGAPVAIGIGLAVGASACFLVQ